MLQMTEGPGVVHSEEQSPSSTPASVEGELTIVQCHSFIGVKASAILLIITILTN